MISKATTYKDNISMFSDKKNEYSITINSDSYSFLEIIINSKNKVPSIIYQETFSLETIKKNKYFSICESMSEVLSALIPNIKNVNNIKLIEKIDNIDIIVSLPHPSCPQIIFNVKSKKKEINESINELYELIDKLYKKIEEQQNIINEQNNKIINLEKNFIEKETKVNYSFNKDSKIIMNDENKEKMIREWINPNKNIKFTLLFRKSRDGSSW